MLYPDVCLVFFFADLHSALRDWLYMMSAFLKQLRYIFTRSLW